MTTSRRCSCLRRFLVVAAGIFFIVCGVYLYINWIEMFTRLRGKEMALSPTSPAFPDWKVSPLPLNFDVYLFNWTNPQDYYVGSNIKPRFEQLGPYRFREAPDKVGIEWHNQNASISFRKKAAFYFDEEGSRGSLKDKITSVNTVAHGAALRAKDANRFQKGMLRHALSLYNEELVVTKTADEWMFTGYSDPIVTMGSVISLFNSDIVVPYNRIGWMYTRNNSATYDGHFNMYTGADDIYKMGQVYTWNHMTHTGVYEGACGDVKGSMGEFFPPNLSTNDTVYIFLPNLCRAVPLDFTEMTEIHGVKAFKFSGGARAVDNGTLYPAESCFCVNGKCQPSGVINIAPCKFNSSIYMSFPHFYKADPSYLQAVEGLSPDPEKHEFFMALEPNAGVPLDVGGGFQANYLMEPVEGIAPFENIPRTFIPLMWAEERVRVTPEIAKEVALVPLIVLLGQIFTSILLAGGVILICWYPTKFVTQMCHDPKAKSTLLNPLGGAAISAIAKRSPPAYPLGQGAGVTLLEYKLKNGAIIRANGTVSESLLGNTLRQPPNDVMIR